MQVHYVKRLAQHLLLQRRSALTTEGTDAIDLGSTSQPDAAGLDASDNQHLAEPCVAQMENVDGPEEGFTRSISIYYNWMQAQRAAARIGRGTLSSSQALILQCEHWLEAADPKHRYGTNLRPYFEHWLAQQPPGRGAHAPPAGLLPHAPGAPRSTNSCCTPPPPACRTSTGPSCSSGSPSSGPSGGAGARNGGLLRSPLHCVQPTRGHGGAPSRSLDVSAPPLPCSQGAPSPPPRRTCSAPSLRDADPEPGAAPPPPAPVARLLPAAASTTAAAASSSKVAAATAAALLSEPGCTHQRFFYWLDEGPGRHTDLVEHGVPRTKLDSQRVHYLDPEELSRLEVTVARDSGLLVFRASGQAVHTGSELALVHAVTAPPAPNVLALDAANVPADVRAAGVASDGRGAAGADAGAALDAAAGAAPPASTAAAAAAAPLAQARATDVDAPVRGPEEPDSATVVDAAAARSAALRNMGLGEVSFKDKPCKWIYVLDTNGRLYVHAKYRGRFHHSSFVQGGAVLSAGGIVADHGRITKLTADSGHYRPRFESFMGMVQLLKDWGADLSATKLSAKHIKCPDLPEAQTAAAVATQQQQQGAAATAVGRSEAAAELPVPLPAVQEGVQLQPAPGG